jgi:hypothetical protein
MDREFTDGKSAFTLTTVTGMYAGQIQATSVDRACAIAAARGYVVTAADATDMAGGYLTVTGE